MTALSPVQQVAHDLATRPEHAARWAANQMEHDLRRAVEVATDCLRTIARQQCRNCSTCAALRADAERVMARAIERWTA